MLRTRVISAVIAIAILVPLLLFTGTIGVAALVTIASALGVREVGKHLPTLAASPARELSVGMVIVLVAGFYLLPPVGIMGMVVWFPLAVLMLHVLLYGTIEETVRSTADMIFVLAYTVIPLGHAVLLRRLDMGVAWVLFVMIVICLGDAGAYFAGKRFGKHRLAPRISPAKTIEGLGGVFVAGFIAMLGMKAAVPDLGSFRLLIPLVIVLSIVGPLGDLCASALKRQLGIKDFGSLMPGHGGLMDRADSLILAFPAAYYYLLLTGRAVPQ